MENSLSRVAACCLFLLVCVDDFLPVFLSFFLSLAGVVLYELCTYEHPFEGPTLYAIGRRIMSGTYPPVSDKYSSNSRSLLSRMLLLNPKERPSMRGVYMSAKTVSLHSLLFACESA